MPARLSDDECELALYCVNEVVDRRSRAGVPVTPKIRHLSRKLDLASLTSEVSASGHEKSGGSERLVSDRLIGSREAANILGLSTRQVRRLASDLDGRKYGGRNLFRLSTVTEYAQERSSERCQRGI